MKTLVAVNVLTSVNSLAYSSHCQEWFRMAKHFPGDDFILYNPHRASIDRMRNEAAKMALELECDYLYFIDDDMILYPATYKLLREAQKDIIMAHTIIRGYPFDNMQFIDPGDKGFKTDRETVEGLGAFNDYQEYLDGDGLLRVDSIGCACALFDVQLFKELDFPYFATLPNCTEDVFCCMRIAKKYGRQNVHMYVHMGCPTGHIMDNEVVTAGNKERMRVRAEEDFPSFLTRLNADRGEEYSERIVKDFENSIQS